MFRRNPKQLRHHRESGGVFGADGDRAAPRHPAYGHQRHSVISPALRAALAMLCLTAGNAHAQVDSQAPPGEGSEGGWLDVIRTLEPYAALAWSHDSNLLRNPAGLGDESDQYLTLEAGLNSRLDVSRQRFLIDARVFRNSYDRFDQFDYTGGDGRLLWRWAAGRLWEGDLGYRYVRRLRDFGNELIATKDISDRHRIFGSARRWLTPRWRIGVNSAWSDISFSESARLDKNIYDYGAHVDYVSLSGNVAGLAADYAESRFSNRDDRDYEDLSFGPFLDWGLTAKTRILANAGYKSRTHDVLDERDFDGFVGRLAADWQATGKTTIRAAVWRDISNLDDEIANFAVVQGVSVEPVWNITAKTSLTALASYEQRDFQGGDDIDFDVSERTDDVTAFGLGLNWQPRRRIGLSLDYRSETRDSNRRLREYDYDFFEVRVNVGL